MSRGTERSVIRGCFARVGKGGSYEPGRNSRKRAPSTGRFPPTPNPTNASIVPNVAKLGAAPALSKQSQKCGGFGRGDFNLRNSEDSSNDESSVPRRFSPV